MNLIIIHPNELADTGTVVLSDERAKHIRKVLKAEPGKELRIGLLNGPFGTGTVESVNKSEVTLCCQFDESIPERPPVDLLLAMPRPKVMKRLWAQLAALGVGRIILLNAEKVEKFYFDSHVLEPEFYEKRLIEGLQQARCTQMPEVLIRRRFKPFVEDQLEELFSGQLRLLADPSGDNRLESLIDATSPRVVVAIGPEGGWTPYELEHLESHGFQSFSMGARILRTDTASVGLLNLLNHLLAAL